MARIDRADAAAEMAFSLGPEIVSFRKQAACIEGHDIDVDAAVMDHVQQCLILDTEARGEGDLAFDFIAELHKTFDRR